MIQNYIRWLLYALIIIFPIGLLARVKVMPSVQVVPQDFVAALICLLVIVLVVSGRNLGRFKNFYILQILFLLIGLLSLGFNMFMHSDISITPSAMYALRYFLYLHLIVAIGVLDNFNLMKKLLLWSGGVILAIGFIQFVFFNSLRPLFYLGWDDHLYRLFSTFLDPNFTGLFLVMYLFVLLREVFIHPFRSSYMHLILAFFSGLAIMLTYSRTALVALMSGLIVFGLLKRKFVTLFAALTLIAIVVFAVSDVTVEGLNPFRTQSTSERVKSMREAITIFVDSPFLGSGFNAYRYALVRYDFRDPLGAMRSNSDSGTDSSFLFVLATTGIIGFVLFVSSYALLIKKILKVAGRTKFLFISYCAVFIVGSLFVNALFYIPILTWFFLSIIFFIEKKN